MVPFRDLLLSERGRSFSALDSPLVSGTLDHLTGGLYSDQQIRQARDAVAHGLLMALHGELLNVAIEGGLGLALSTAGSSRSPFPFPPSLSRLRLGWFV
jgi:hypothetical protein